MGWTGGYVLLALLLAPYLRKFGKFTVPDFIGYFGINPPGFVAAVVALAFGLAAASFFPAIILGIFSKRMNMQGAVA
ncbi:unnamed protein product, partial [Darwinula stevensoni]